MTADFTAARANMVESQVRTADVTDLALTDVIRKAPRESLLPAAKAHAAYADAEVEYTPGRWLLRPRDISKLLQILRPRAGERALAIAAPYAALVLEGMGLAVERLDEGDLKAVSGGDYDLIVCEGAVAKTPDAWTAALKLGGRLGVVERSGPAGRAMVYVRADDGISGLPVFDSAPPYLAGFEPVAGFAF